MDADPLSVSCRTWAWCFSFVHKAHDSGDTQPGGQMQTVVTRILHVFVDALPHVPEHRRIPILKQLLGTLGPAHFLWILMLLLFKQHATSTAVSSTGAEKVSLLNVS